MSKNYKDEYLGTWTGVDFDGTLVEYHGWKGKDVVGAPVPSMVQRVKGWLLKGMDVRVFTARVAGGESLDQQRYSEEARKTIQEWCLEHLGQVLPVVCTKDHLMRELWDDRSIQVEFNTGVPMVDKMKNCANCAHSQVLGWSVQCENQTGDKSADYVCSAWTLGK